MVFQAEFIHERNAANVCLQDSNNFGETCFTDI